MSQKQKESLESIYSFVVGIVILAFVWIAIDTFAPKEMPSYGYYRGDGYVLAETRSLISIVVASICAFISIYFSKKLKLVSNGLLIGSFLVFLMAIVSGLFSGESTFRFFVITLSLIAILVVGYFKFSKNTEQDNDISDSVQNSTPIAPQDNQQNQDKQ